jgi:DNA mismatch repair protein MutL
VGSPGTRLEVRHLFFNTPVRRKFLRQAGTEMGHITETFTRLALPHARRDDQPGLHLTLRHNNKSVHETPAAAGLRERIRLFFGPAISEQLYAIDARQGPISLTGFVADPACGSGTARMQYLFLNGRWFRDRTLGHAVQEAYRGLLMTGRYAVVFLFLDLPPDLVDVNVHPTKSEVRFRDSQVLHHLAYTAIRDRLRKENLTPRLQVASTLRPTTELGGEPPPWELRPSPSPAPVLPFDQAAFQAAAASAVSTPAPTPPQPTIRVLPPEQMPIASPREKETPVNESAEPPTHRPTIAQTKMLQLYDSYLVLETDEGMLVIDQHALHERILFDQLQRRIREGTLETQPFLLPEPVELTSEQAARVLEQREALAELGLGIEDFGGGTVLLTRYPTLLGQRAPVPLLRAVVDHLMNQDRMPSRAVLFNSLLSLMACHAAVRAGDRLTPEQMAALLEQRHLADDIHHCPHGRPTALLFSKQDLEKQFRRI